eukprot:m.293660 g.293660  ORF g.293660 m.293660 type:complete len:525 (+) comp12842_c0_seq1:102-1676(+)
MARRLLTAALRAPQVRLRSAMASSSSLSLSSSLRASALVPGRPPGAISPSFVPQRVLSHSAALAAAITPARRPASSAAADSGVFERRANHRFLVLQPRFTADVEDRHADHQERLDEAMALVRAVDGWDAGMGITTPMRHRNPDSTHFFGKGKLEELSDALQSDAEWRKCDAVFVNTLMLPPKVQQYLSERWKRPVYDRYSMILQIFHERADTPEAKLQVELARIPYQRARLGLPSGGAHDHQAAGMRGRGESELEAARQKLKAREAEIRKLIELASKTRERHFSSNDMPIVALVGYTNAGKTHLLRALSGDLHIEPKDKLFATLSTKMRVCKLPSGLRVLVVDTVGFIRDLPPLLIESFRSTLHAVEHAHLLLHVQDLSCSNFDEHKQNVVDVLSELDLPHNLQESVINVWNKADTKESYVEPVEENTVAVSAKTRYNIDKLKLTMEKMLLEGSTTTLKAYIISLPVGAVEPINYLHSHGRILNQAVTKDGKLERFRVILSKEDHDRFRAKFYDAPPAAQEARA